MKPITLWYIWSAKYKAFVFNHIQDGYKSEEIPTYRCEHQRLAWTSAKWEKKFANLNERNQVV